MKNLDLEKMAEALEASGGYRVLRLLEPSDTEPAPSDIATRKALFVDVETTGLNPEEDEIIELAMVPFTYSLDGHIYETHLPFHGLRQPKAPLPKHICKTFWKMRGVTAGVFGL